MHPLTRVAIDTCMHGNYLSGVTWWQLLLMVAFAVALVLFDIGVRLAPFLVILLGSILLITGTVMALRRPAWRP